MDITAMRDMQDDRTAKTRRLRTAPFVVAFPLNTIVEQQSVKQKPVAIAEQTMGPVLREGELRSTSNCRALTAQLRLRGIVESEAAWERQQPDQNSFGERMRLSGQQT